jgi:hypothetical protein
LYFNNISAMIQGIGGRRGPQRMRVELIYIDDGLKCVVHNDFIDSITGDMFWVP